MLGVFAPNWVYQTSALHNFYLFLKLRYTIIQIFWVRLILGQDIYNVKKDFCFKETILQNVSRFPQKLNIDNKKNQISILVVYFLLKEEGFSWHNLQRYDSFIYTLWTHIIFHCIVWNYFWWVCDVKCPQSSTFAVWIKLQKWHYFHKKDPKQHTSVLNYTLSFV